MASRISASKGPSSSVDVPEALKEKHMEVKHVVGSKLGLLKKKLQLNKDPPLDSNAPTQSTGTDAASKSVEATAEVSTPPTIVKKSSL